MAVVEPALELVEGEGGVDGAGDDGVGGLALLGEAGADEDDEGVGAVLLLEVAAVRDHGGDDRRDVVDEVGIDLLDQVHDDGARRGDDGPALFVGERPLLVDGSDHRGAERGFAAAGKAKLGQCVRDRLERGQAGRGAAVDREVGRDGGGDARHDGATGCKRGLDRGQAVADDLGVLRAGAHAGTALDAQLGDDLGLAARHPHGLDRADADAAVAVAAAGRVGADHGHEVRGQVRRRSPRGPETGAQAGAGSCKHGITSFSKKESAVRGSTQR